MISIHSAAASAGDMACCSPWSGSLKPRIVCKVTTVSTLPLDHLTTHLSDG